MFTSASPLRILWRARTQLPRFVPKPTKKASRSTLQASRHPNLARPLVTPAQMLSTSIHEHITKQELARDLCQEYPTLHLEHCNKTWLTM